MRRAWPALFAWATIMQVMFMRFSADAFDHRVGAVELMAGISRAPMTYRSAIVRTIGMAFDLPPTIADEAQAKHALIALAIAQWVAFAVAAFACWSAFSDVVQRNATRTFLAFGAGALFFLTPGMMLAYDPFVFSTSAVLLALYVSGRVNALAVALLASFVVKETLPFFGFVAVFDTWRREQRSDAARIAAATTIALIARALVPVLIPAAHGVPLELHLLENFRLNDAPFPYWIYALCAPAILLAAIAFGWKSARFELRLGVAAVTLFGACSLLVLGRIAESRIWLEYLPWCMAVAATRIERVQATA